jgi:hypothetical protein
MRRVAENYIGCRLFHHLSGVHNTDPIGHIRMNAHVVRYQDDRIF